MIEYAEIVHYGTIALVVSVSAVGVGIGQGNACSSALGAMNRQPQAKKEIIRTAILGTVISETAAIIGLVMSVILLFGSNNQTINMPAALAEFGIACAICIASFIIGIVSAMPVQEACFAVARQPFFSEKIVRFMLITQSVIQTPIIFGFVVAMFIRNQIHDVHTMVHGLKLLAGGLCMGIGTIGPAIGLGTFAQTAVNGLGINRSAYGPLMTFMFVNQAIIETPIIFTLVTSLMIIASPAASPITGIAMIAAALCMGLGTLGTGNGAGKTAAAACHQIAINPSLYQLIANASMFGLALIDACAIYSFLVAMLIILIQ